MKFDVYFPFRNREGKCCPGVTAHPMSFEEILSIMDSADNQKLIGRVRTGDKDAKIQLPSVCYTGVTTSGKRAARFMKPTQLVMVDVDHCENPLSCYEAIIAKSEASFREDIACIHKTPSGKGLRVVFRAQAGMKTLKEQMQWFNDFFEIAKYGDPDTGVHDFSRISFLVPRNDFYYMNGKILNEEIEDREQVLVNSALETQMFTDTEETKDEKSGHVQPVAVDMKKEEEEQTELQAEFAEMEFRGTKVGTIIKKYVEVQGTPSGGEIHNFYNEMVKNFRCIMDNNKRALLAWLPRFGHTKAECESQIASICRVNTLSRLPRDFYFFLKDNGFYVPKTYEDPKVKDYLLSEEVTTDTNMPPYLPPVFREFVEMCPKDFVVPCVVSLLPVLGTLTSYVQACYPYDGRMHTTSFFSVIYAPAGTGKGFVERIIDVLFEDLKLRDAVQSARENIFLRVIQRKGANDKAPDRPHVSLRIIPPKNSEAEFLEKQSDNQGYHMFTYAAEMDSWAKGVRAAGGNKDDMLRVAWDNGEYGQQFKSANTFKGIVRLFWNVLITGTLPQLESYFKNVENGLVTRCSFSSIENQEFALPPKFRSLSKKSMKTLRGFMDRCDRRTYESPCTVDASLLSAVNDDDFDNEIDWKFKFRERQTLDCAWIMPTINAFHEEQMGIAAQNVDRARDVFRRRAGVRGFRLALLCMCLWEKPRAVDLEKCKAFVDWFMHVDLENSLKLWGAKYNEISDPVPNLTQRNVFNSLPDEFEKSDLYVVTTKQGIKTPLRQILFSWKRIGVVKEVEKGKFKKVKKDE